MKRLLILILLCSFASATTTVTGKIQNLGTGNVTSGAFVRFWLRGCSGNQPRVNGTSVIGPSQGGVYFYDIAADGSGNVSGILFSTRDATGLLGGDIECGGSLTAVWYGMQIFSAGKGGPETPIHAKSGGILDITSITPITTNPVITAPTGDATYLRLDAGNSPITGTVSNTSAGGFNGKVGAVLPNTGAFTALSSSGLAALSGGGALAGTFSGNPAFTGLPTFVSQATSNAGIFTDTQFNEYLTSLIGGINLQTEYQASGFIHNLTEGLAGGVAVPVGSTVTQADGVAGWVNNSSTSTNAVGGYFHARCLATGTACWGANPAVSSTPGHAATLIGQETDINVTNAGDSAAGMTIAGFWTAQPTGSNAMIIGKPAGLSGAAQWNYGMYVGAGCCATAGILIGPAATSGSNVASMALQFQHNDGTGVTRASTINVDTGGNLQVSPYGGITQINGSLQASVNLKAQTYSTSTNCAVNSVSPAACGSASSGAVVIPTTTVTYTINTTAVTTHSRIMLTWLSFAADLPGSPTCVAPAVTGVTSISAISSGTSFTISLPSTTGQTCPMFTIVN